jgi:DNA-directed RNA polymerase specialized sigma24 family protein
MFGATKIEKQQPSPYATATDFCQIFETDMNRLYRLSFLLTGDEPAAEQCFLGGLQMAQEGNPVFRNWAEAWARRMIILDAIRVLHPQLIVDTSEAFGRVAHDCATDRIEIAEIVKLPVFERFAFVMSVLEGYSDHECSLHLGCTRAAVAAARVRALERIGRAAELRDELVSVASNHKQQGTDSKPAARLRPLTIMLVSA